MNQRQPWALPSRFLAAVLFLLLPLCFPARAYAAAKGDIVVIDSATAAQSADGATLHFYPAEAMRVLKRESGRLLVQRLDEQPGAETASDNDNQLAKRPAWIAAQAVLWQRDFVRVTVWQGEKTFVSCSGSCDAGTSYTLTADGSFVSVSGTNDEQGLSRRRGHLFRHGRVLWARPDRPVRFDDVGEFFIINADDTLCTVVECFWRSAASRQ